MSLDKGLECQDKGKCLPSIGVRWGIGRKSFLVKVGRVPSVQGQVGRGLEHRGRVAGASANGGVELDEL